MPATADLPGFRRMFPELAAMPDDVVMELLEVGRGMHRLPRLQLLATAHLAALRDDHAAGSSGEVRRRRAGELAVSYLPQAEGRRGSRSGSRDAYWTATSYGRRYLILAQRRRFW